MSDDKLLQVEVANRVGTLTLNRLEVRNSLSPELLTQLIASLNGFSRTDEVRVVVIRGAGDKSFCAGYDLNMLPTNKNVKNDGIELFEEAMQTIQTFPYPVIAMMNGYAFGGGCDLAISCDIRIGAEDIRIGMVPAKLGVVYSAAGLKRFTKVLGQARTRELFFTGRHYHAPFLKEIGFLNYVLPKDELESFTYKMAGEIALNSPLSLKGIKKVLQLLDDSSTLSEKDRWEAHELAKESFFSEDLKEGQAAFFEKRTPNFKGF